MHEKALVQKILESPYGYEWSVQGLGMLRLYLSKEVRLHIWDSSLRVAGVSDIHTHPWEFVSYVVTGELVNTRLVPEGTGTKLPVKKQEIFCGVGGGLLGEPEKVTLYVQDAEVYTEGDTYHQYPNEIHYSKSRNGTVSIIERKFEGDEDHAYVYWSVGEWVSAEPRPATPNEINRVTKRSLDAWFNGN